MVQSSLKLTKCKHFQKALLRTNYQPSEKNPIAPKKLTAVPLKIIMLIYLTVKKANFSYSTKILLTKAQKLNLKTLDQLHFCLYNVKSN